MTIGDDKTRQDDILREQFGHFFFFYQLAVGDFVANKFRRGQISHRKKLVGFLKNRPEILVGPKGIYKK